MHDPHVVLLGAAILPAQQVDDCLLGLLEV